jgi:hypothetical protein
VFGVGGSVRTFRAQRTRFSVIGVTLVALLAGTVSAVAAEPAQATPGVQANSPKNASVTGAV